MIKALALLALLCLSLPSAAQALSDEALKTDRTRLAETAQAIREFKTINGGYPSSLEELEAPTYRVNPDSAGRKPVYKLTNDGVSFELSYVGPDGVEGTGDDIRLEPSKMERRTAKRPVVRWIKRRGY